MITKEQLQKLADECAESIISDTDAGTAAEYGFIAGFEAAMRLLQQTQCCTQPKLSNMGKVVKDGKVAVLYSPAYGAGWYSWNTDHKELLFHPKIVEMVEQGKQADIDDDWVNDNLGIDIYAGGARDLRIEWLPEGTAFHVEEYDGSETITNIDSLTIVA